MSNITIDVKVTDREVFMKYITAMDDALTKVLKYEGHECDVIQMLEEHIDSLKDIHEEFKDSIKEIEEKNDVWESVIETEAELDKLTIEQIRSWKD